MGSFSKLIWEIKELIVSLDNQNKKIILVWVPGHTGVRGNKKADWLAKRGRALRCSNIRLVFEDKLIQYGYKLWVEGIRLGYQNAAANVSTNYAANDGGYCDILRKKMALSTNLKAMAMTLVINSTIPASRHCNYQEMDRKKSVQGCGESRGQEMSMITYRMRREKLMLYMTEGCVYMAYT
ncbi:hypothetical protein QE152_g28363 [Popillia japonica]|uniref:RNase H type-1 domain-containing protein n=1 Tax=Popillia japonica TaxID=7064 RepID=A0AAW1JJA0_POPJA